MLHRGTALARAVSAHNVLRAAGRRCQSESADTTGLLASPALSGRPSPLVSSSPLLASAGLSSSAPLRAHRLTRIVATWGPALSAPGVASAAIASGIDIARINCAHGDVSRPSTAAADGSAEVRGVGWAYERSVEQIRKEEQTVQRLAPCKASALGAQAKAAASAIQAGIAAPAAPISSLSTSLLPVAFDIKGPEIRIGKFSPTAPGYSKDGIPLARKEVFKLTNNVAAAESGNKATGIYCTYHELPKTVSRGSRIYVDDGNIELEVLSVDQAAGEVVVQSLTDAPLQERKGVNLPGIDVELPHVTAKDEKDIAAARALGADILFASFVQSADMVRTIRSLAGANVSIVSKIESQAGIDNYDEILEASDGIMVARGDLGVQIPAERVFLAQKRLVARANILGKPIICATQMLESMTVHPRPTRAECVDVANAVLDGTDAVMLSGETAKGKYPVEAVKMMDSICRAAEGAYPHRSFFNTLTEVIDTSYVTPVAFVEGRGEGWGEGRGEGLSGDEDGEHLTQADIETIASAAVHASFESNAALMVVLTVSGNTAGLVAKYRPNCPVFCVTTDPVTARRRTLHRGVYPILVPVGSTVLENRRAAIAAASAMGIVRPNDRVVTVHGTRSFPGQFGVQISMTHVK